MDTFVVDEHHLNEVVEEVITRLDASNVVLLKGNLGTGKTTFTKLLLQTLGIKDTITSPTFNIVSEYRLDSGKQVYHFDLYRIQSADELYEIGFEEYIDSGNLCIIEWPEISEHLLNLNCITIEISIEGNLRRYELI
ncbi:MAG: tRNA (adenosine(37)-N6)-threonylcarbamoyltransferase complex ATPase subunit type 1 TsaE [Bacteroidota bacterium]